MRSLALAVILLSGCSLYPFSGDDDVCERDLAEPAPERKVNPSTLACEEFSTGYCDAECGPCPLNAGAVWIPSWGRCESECSTMSETQCMSASQCRVTRDHDAYYVNAPSFEGCYEISDGDLSGADLFALPCEMRDAEQCAMSSQCTGLYEMYGGAPPLHAPRGEFLGCIDEAQVAGVCHSAVACRAEPPTCPENTTPGVANGCWTGSCIPNSVCATTGG